MRTAMLTSYGPSPRIEIVRHPTPEQVAPGHIVVAVAGISLNPVDIEVAAGVGADGFAVSPPFIVGWDLAGTVTNVGDGVDAFRPGDQVVAMSAQVATGIGTAAEYVHAPASLFAIAPVSVSLAEAAGLPLAALSAYEAFRKASDLHPDGVLVVGVGGAVGTHIAQLAMHDGHTVYGVGTRQDGNHAQQLRLAGFATRTDELRRDFELVFDAAGIPECAQLVAPGGRYISVVPRRTPAPSPDIEVINSFVQESGHHLAHLVRMLDQGALTLRIGAVFGLEEIHQAYERQLTRGIRGKTIVQLANSTEG